MNGHPSPALQPTQSTLSDRLRQHHPQPSSLSTSSVVHGNVRCEAQIFAILSRSPGIATRSRCADTRAKVRLHSDCGASDAVGSQTKYALLAPGWRPGSPPFGRSLVGSLPEARHPQRSARTARPGLSVQGRHRVWEGQPHHPLRLLDVEVRSRRRIELHQPDGPLVGPSLADDRIQTH